MRLALRSQDADDGRHDRKKNHDGDYVVDTLSDIGNQMTEKIAAEDHRSDPEDAPEDVERQVAAVVHLRRAGYRGTKRSNDGHKAGQNHSPPAVLLIKIVGALEVAAPEEERIVAAIERRPRRTSDPIADLVADDSAEHHRQEQQPQRDYASGGEDARGDEQGISWKKEADKESCFHKNNRADKGEPAGAD